MGERVTFVQPFGNKYSTTRQCMGMGVEGIDRRYDHVPGQKPQRRLQAKG